MQDGRSHLALLLIPWSGDLLQDTNDRNKAKGQTEGAEMKTGRRRRKVRRKKDREEDERR